MLLRQRSIIPASSSGIGFRAFRDLIVERLPFHDEVVVDHWASGGLGEAHARCHSVWGWGLKRRTSWGQPHASATLPAHILAVSSSATSTSANPPRNSLVSM